MNAIDAFCLGFGLAAIFSGLCAFDYCRKYFRKVRDAAYEDGYDAGRSSVRREWKRAANSNS